ncbi:HDOD domain-containing protein [Methylocaldum sp. MU1018]
MNTLILAIGIISLGMAGWLGVKLIAARGRAAGSDIQDSPVAESERIRTEPVSPEILRRLAPLAGLGEEELIAFASGRSMEFYPAGTTVFRGGESPETAFFLLKGTVMIGSDRGVRLKVDSDSEAARFPLDRDEPGPTANAWTDVWVLRVPAAILQQYAEKSKARSITPPDLARLPVPPALGGSSLYYVFCHTFHKGALDLPAFPSVAFKLRQAMMRKDIDFVQAAKIVQMDPSLATKLVQVANSPLYFTADPVKTCQSAIARLGLVTTRNLIFSMGMKGLFSARNPEIRKLMQDVWKSSVHLSAVASVLAAKTGRVDPDKALLGGLIVRIGAIPFLSFAEKFRSEYHDSAELEAALSMVQGPVGRYLLTQWEFAEEYLDLPVTAEQWSYSSGTERPDLADIVRLAAWHSRVGTSRAGALPPITELPAYAKLKDAALTPGQSLKVLHDAKEQIAETLSVLSQ